MASTGGGAARSSKKKNPDIADQEEISATDLVGTVGTIDSVERKLDLLVTTIAALANSVNKLVGGVEAKDEKVIDKLKTSDDKNGKKRRDNGKMNENFIPDIGEIVKLAYSNSFASKRINRNETDIGPYMVVAPLYDAIKKSFDWRDSKLVEEL